LFRGELEWSDPDFSSDFDYRRYMLTIVRYQNVNKYSNFRLRGEFAGSDGYLPMYKRFFLGGLGTLWGYKHKEFVGSRYWLANSEYWINLPTNFESNLILFWDVARISNSSSFEEADEVLHDIGVGLVLADIRFNLAKRLDSNPERDPRFYLRFSRSF
jgi:hemolysin activation/secretion protein